jgi:glycosyltransferase involved in cell wall biosynthesis
VEKKAPHLLILAFSEVHRQRPDAQLRIIGDGPLLPFCRELVRQLRLGDSVEFLGVQPHERVQVEMRRSRGFAQHSIVASSGDSEGTPVAVMEASASGLPVIATDHAGIPDVVVDGVTGFLVDEGDVFAMASSMLKLVEDPMLAQRMGRAGRARVEQQFSQQISLERIWAIIQQCHTTGNRPDHGAMTSQSEAA